MTETRAEKAQRLVDEGAVNIYWDTEICVGARVKANHGSHDTYLYRSGLFWCSCHWGLYHNYSYNLCAHALAVKLAVSLGSP